MKNCAAQFSKDTQCYETKVIQQLLIDAQQKDILEGEVEVLDKRILELKNQLRIVKLEDSLKINSLNYQISQAQGQKEILNKAIDELYKIIRKQKRKTRWTAIAGIVTTVAGIFFLK